ncbi:hypothetical protein ACFTSF_10150 [Kribbella sp. NPDC056951]|uniref:hypothetical protein n=1 Tax=Kribbella sp. NPDC056951 TaxID=3345978 RepID=UPI00363F7FFA
MRFAFGYFKKHFLMTDAEVATRRKRIVDCAVAHQRELVALYIDEIATAPNELHNALTAVMNLPDCALIVPNLFHFASIGNPLELRQVLRTNQVELLLSEPPQSAGRAC